MASRLIALATSDGPTLTAAATASCLPTNVPWTLPAGYWQVGRAWRIRAAGRISCAVTTPGTARYDLFLGSVVAFDTLAIPLNVVAKTTVSWFLDVDLVCRAAGSGTSTNLMSKGYWMSEANILVPLPATGPGPGAAMVPFNTAPVVGTGFNCQTALTVDFRFTQTVATGSMTLHQFYIEELT